MGPIMRARLRRLAILVSGVPWWAWVAGWLFWTLVILGVGWLVGTPLI